MRRGVARYWRYLVEPPRSEVRISKCYPVALCVASDLLTFYSLSLSPRFCDELGRRDYVTGQILLLHPDHQPNTTWDASLTLPQPFIVLSVATAANASKHIEFYAWKGFLRKVQGCQGIAEAIGCSVERVESTLQEYQQAAKAGKDAFGKTRFVGIPELNEEFYIGTVVPVLHYCQGGLSIDVQGHVLDKEGEPIPGLYACGEVSGGVHGENRLAGNSLLECVVYGRIVSQTIRDGDE